MPFCCKSEDGSRLSKKHETIQYSGSDVKNKLKEKDVGITEYISRHEGFSGIIKQRFSDFHVNEIDVDGNIVTLKSITAPTVEGQVMGTKADHENTLKAAVSEAVFETIKNLVDQDEGGTCVEIEVTDKAKDERKELHNAIKSVGVGKLVSNTKEKEGKKFIIISQHKSKQTEKRDRRIEWPANLGGDYVHFVLHKENIDTMESVNLIASKLRIKPNMITYAGTKDRRGKTSQMMSVWRIEPKRLAQLNTQLRSVTLGNYAFKPQGLKLGDLQGNRFRIVLRNVTVSDEQIKEAMTSLFEKGFLNYYGLQRFGSSFSVPTYEIGKALLQGNWKLAVELILKPREGEQIRDLAEARKVWWETRNASRALKVLRNKEKLIEGKLLLGLSVCKPNEYINALEKIPRNTRLLYLHSYQSVVWNKLVSRRVKVFGLQPLPGDLMFVNESQKGFFNKPEETSIQNKDEDDDEPEVDAKEASNDETNTTVHQKKSYCTVITEKDVSSVSIYDIVMPLPGHDVVYPENVLRDWYEELLELDGLSSTTLKQNVRKYSVSGAYRKVVVRPGKMNWKTVHYSDPEKTLELSDIEIMKNISAPIEDPDGTYKALILDFCLPSSTYATMALREILKEDTSAEHQASLNSYHLYDSSKCVSYGERSTSDKDQNDVQQLEVSAQLLDASDIEEAEILNGVSDTLISSTSDKGICDVERNDVANDNTSEMEESQQVNSLKRKDEIGEESAKKIKLFH